jgi:hypothetical protein
MELYVRSKFGEKTLSVEPTEPIQLVRSKVREAFAVDDHDDVNLIYYGHKLADGSSLRDYRIGPRATILALPFQARYIYVN